MTVVEKTVTTVTVTEMGMKSTQRCILQRRVCHKSMAHPLLCYLLHNPRSIVAYSKKGIILYRLQILLFPIFSIINRQEVHKRA